MKEIIKTSRLIIRQFIPEDWSNVYEMNSDPEVIKMIGNGKLRSYEDEHKAFQEKIINYLNAEFGVWAVIREIDNGFIGTCNLSPAKDTNEIMVGYRLMKKFWGCGYATEISQALIEYGFAKLNLKRIVGLTNLENIASQRVLEKSGLKFEKEGRYYDWDMKYFSINKYE
jgi:[ribosomal protein S5]-alanine N-acetyltransferase